MKAGRAFSLLAGIMVLGVIARFNEMTADAQASWLDAAAAMAQGTPRSLLHKAAATDGGMTGAPERPGHAPVRPGVAEHRGGGDAPPPRIADAKPPARAGNPLWALPLGQLSVTRERPVFSPSRRPPPPPPVYVAPVAAQQPVKPPEPERPAVSLLGTVIGASDQIGVFLDAATQKVVSLHAGEDHQGWVLRLIKAREVTLVKGEQAAVLELSPSGETPVLGGPAVAGGLPGAVTGVIPILSSTNDADEQPTGWRAPRARGR
jgi:hypothetical protein